MVNAIRQFVRNSDAAVARVYLSLFRERDALMSFLFHSLFRDEREIEQNVMDPLDYITVAKFRQVIEYYLENGYRFVSPNDLLNGLRPDGKYAMLTFDDGYFNNTLALPVLEELRVPALFFISANHVRENKCFWWDVLYRERFAQGATQQQLYDEALELKSLRTEAIEDELRKRFGPRALDPRGDIDRPFNPSELRDFAANPYVHIGNHTANHAILTNYSDDEIYSQIADAQKSLTEMTGVTPYAIAYPNGAYDERVVKACVKIGLKFGFTVAPGKISLPVDAENPALFRLGRFVPHAFSPIAQQCQTYRSDLQLYGMLRNSYLKILGRQVTS